MFLRKVVLKICSKFTGEHPCRSAISIFIEIALWHGCSPVNLLQIFRTPFSRNTSGWLLLQFAFSACQVEVFENTLKLRCWPLTFTAYKAFLETKKRSETSVPTSIHTWCFKKTISHVIFQELIKFDCLIVFSSWDIRQCGFCNHLRPSRWRHKS